MIVMKILSSNLSVLKYGGYNVYHLLLHDKNSAFCQQSIWISYDPQNKQWLFPYTAFSSFIL
jgi:hypothetical protein